MTLSSSPSFLLSAVRLFFIFFLLSSLVPIAICTGGGGTFYASAVSYCSSARAIEVDTFLIQYDDAIIPSVTFDISARSVVPGLRSNLDLSLSAYGINAINNTIDLCAQSLGGLVCPLPVYNFVGSATIPLPASISTKIQIPSLAFVIPDLEATAYIRLYEQGTGKESACLQVDLANGLSTRLLGVSWGLAGLLIGSILISMLGAGIRIWKGQGNIAIEGGRRNERALTIMSWYQFVATTGLLSVKYPLVVTSFTSNFAWSLGLIYSSRIQTAIDQTRTATGGNTTDLAGNLVGGTESLRSLYSRTATLPLTTTEAMNALAQQYSSSSSSSSSPSNLSRRASDSYAIPTVQENSYDSIQTGFFRWVTGLEISPFNAFTTVLIFSLVCLAVYFLLSIVVLLPFLSGKKEIVYLTSKEKRGSEIVNEKLQFRFRTDVAGVDRQSIGRIIKGNALRLLIVLWFPLTIFSFFQWSLGNKDSWVPIVLSSLNLVITTSAILYISICTFIYGRRSARRNENSHLKVMDSLNRNNSSCLPLWNSYRSQCWWFFVPVLSTMFIRALLLAFGRNHGWVQSISLEVLEFIVLMVMAFTKPYTKKSTNALNIIFQVFRVLVQGALIAFNSSLQLNEIKRVILGFGIIILESLAVLTLFILVILDLISTLQSLRSSSTPPQSNTCPRRDSESTIGVGGGSEIEPNMSERDRSHSIARSQGSMTLAEFDGTLDDHHHHHQEEGEIMEEVREEGGGKSPKGIWKRYIEP